MAPGGRGDGDHRLELADGRCLSYATYGDPGGLPVINCHGGWLCRTDVAPAAQLAAELGLWIISPDRPGVGRSDRKPGHGMLDWVDEDLTGLVEHLGIDRAGVMGWSAGGQYALAVASRRPELAIGCAVIAGCPPNDDWVDQADLNRADRVLSALSSRHPSLARACFTGMHRIARRRPRLIADVMAKECELTEVPVVRTLMTWGPATLAEGTRNVRGMVDEYLAMDAEWGFALEDIEVAVHIFHGAADKVVPPSWGDVLAERVPGACLTSYPDEGHLIGVTRRREVLEWIRAIAGTPIPD